MTRRVIMLAVLMAASIMTGRAQQPAASAPRHVPVTKAEADRWMTELSNWGRWGRDDQLGALNLITPEKRRQAMALAKSGTVISLERPIVPSGAPSSTAPLIDRILPQGPEAETAARLNRWEFMLVVAPLRVPGSTGSVVNPLAMF